MIRNLILIRGCRGSATLWRVRVGVGVRGPGVPGGPARAPTPRAQSAPRPRFRMEVPRVAETLGPTEEHVFSALS